MQTVGIIGGAGFIGSYITKIFLEENYKVKVSSTDINNKSKYEHLFRLDNAENMMVMALDVCIEKKLEKFVKGCDIIVHSGTPFKLDVSDPENELLKPTVMGTRNLLNVADKTHGLKKVIFISSVAAWNTSFPLVPPIYPAEHFFTEKDEPYMDNEDHPYSRAKFLANREVDKFIGEHPHLSFEIVSISPVLVIGSSLSGRRDATSIGLQYLVKHKIVPDPFVEMLFADDVEFALVDVRDVAESVYRVAQIPDIHGKNYLISNESYPISDISKMLNQIEPVHEPKIVYLNSLARKDLGIAFISAKDTLNYCV